MEVDPYKILEVKKNFSLEELRSQFKKIALSVHPDKVPGQSDYMFKVVTKCYKTLLEELNRRQVDKQFDVLKGNFKKSQDMDKPSSRREEVDRFNIDKFNLVFEKNRRSDVMDVGYEEWMRKNIVKDSPKLNKGITPERFNEKFEQFVDMTKDISNRQIIKFKEPEPMMMSKKLNFIELGVDNIDDFSGENRRCRDLNYTDYKIAHTTSLLVDQKNVKPRADFRTVGDLEVARENIKKLYTKELVNMEMKKALEQETQKKREEYQKMLDEMNYDAFRKMNMMMLGK